MTKKSFDFSGYATKNNLKCADGRVIRQNAFEESDGQRVPLVWQHAHNAPENVIGHAILENRNDGVYAYCKCNQTPSGQNARELVKHGDITALSIYANNLVQKGPDVLHGSIREVSLVLSGANPGALIDNLSIAHGDGTVTDLDDEAIIYTGTFLMHSGEEETEEEDNRTVGEIFNTLNGDQKNVVYMMLASVMDAAEGNDDDDDDVEHSNDEGDYFMKQNTFSTINAPASPALTHDEFVAILDLAKRTGSLRDAFLEHAGTYGIDDIDILFPDAKNVYPGIDLVKRDTEWVPQLMSSIHHSPFSRLKTVYADLTPDEARAKGYITGSLKYEEVIGLFKRLTYPTTVYKKQKLDRDDVVDITDIDVVSWLKSEMRMMLDEEIARAILIGDGRAIGHADKIDEGCIRPVYSDDNVYAHHVELPSTVDTAGLIDEIVKARKEYKGTGSPTMFVGPDVLTDLLLVKDGFERRMYETEAQLAAALRVSKIVEVNLLDDVSREDGDDTLDLICIIFNPRDYTAGADKGGQVSMFDDFDIDYNQMKYLIETRMSGALTKPKSALVIERLQAAG